jgi:hypothetical protein
LTDENPTGSDAGASITDRLERYLAAEDSPAPEPKAGVQAPAETQETQAATETEKPKEDAPETESQPQLTTADLAKVLGIDESTLDVDADGNVSIKTKIDGKEGAAKFADLLKTHQISGHAENRAREVAQREAALQARAQEVEQQFQQKLSHADQLTTLAAQELLAEFQSIDWKALDQHPDQGAVAALKLKFQERNAKIQQAQQGINAHRWQLNQQAQAQQQQRIQAEAAKLPTLIPEWKDQTVAAKESAELIDWGRKSGYSDDELKSLSNSSALHVATVRKAMLFDKLQQSKAVVENKVRLAPKIVKPGQAPTDGAADKLRALKANVTKNGGKNGTLEAFLIATGKV